jgi:hypothetical protein
LKWREFTPNQIKLRVSPSPKARAPHDPVGGVFQLEAHGHSVREMGRGNYCVLLGEEPDEL